MKIIMIQVTITAIRANCQRGTEIEVEYEYETLVLPTLKEAARTNRKTSAVRMKSTN
jgi:hypothetical protein